jgi:polyhydroxybutyrate depolymerase
MKQSAPALLVLILGLLACARNRPGIQSSQADSTRTLTVANIERSYILHIPSSYDVSRAMPLVLSFHGGGGNAENEMRVSNFNSLADEKGFIVAYLSHDRKITFRFCGTVCVGRWCNSNAVKHDVV